MAWNPHFNQKSTFWSKNDFLVQNYCSHFHLGQFSNFGSEVTYPHREWVFGGGPVEPLSTPLCQPDNTSPGPRGYLPLCLYLCVYICVCFCIYNCIIVQCLCQLHTDYLTVSVRKIFRNLLTVRIPFHFMFLSKYIAWYSLEHCPNHLNRHHTISVGLNVENNFRRSACS